MVKLMVDVNLDPPDHLKNINDGGLQLIKLQEYLLSKMEDAGMRPPVDGSTIESMLADVHNKWEKE